MRFILPIVCCFVLVACNENKNSTTADTPALEGTEIVAATENTVLRAFPKAIGPLFQAHGGIERWSSMNNLCFEIVKESGNEIHTTDLNSRATKIEHANWTIGSDGDQVWLLNKSDEGYKGNARFYHNLYFYFYAMPFIVSDPGINYGQMAESLEIEGKKYRGTKISYSNDVGDSPEDEYIVYSDPETGKMTWLAYTVTFNSGEKSDNFRFIKYAQWQEVNGLLLPKKLTWYNVEEGKPTTPRNELVFDKVSVTETVLDKSMFTMPKDAVVVPKK